MSLNMPVTGQRLPYRVDRSAPGVVTIEKFFGNFNPNCVLGLLVIILSIIMPAALAAASPLASFFVFIGSLFFPGVPIGLVNKKWRIEINNVSNQLHVSRWHDFNKKIRKTNTIKFDDIKEIVAETSPDGAKHRLIIIDQAGSRHVLHESMNKIHANKFKDDFMQSIELAGIPRQQGAVNQALVGRSSQPPVIAPQLQQFVVPELNDATILDSSGHNTGFPHDVDSAFARHALDAAPGMRSNGTGALAHVNDLPDSDEAVHERLLAIARHKREVLDRVFDPATASLGNDLLPVPGPGETWHGADAGAGTGNGNGNGSANACSHLRNRGEIFNIFDPCFAMMEFLPQELAGRAVDTPRVVNGEVPANHTPKKHNGDVDAEEVLPRVIDKRTEKELNVRRVRPTCMVCTIPLKGPAFICPTCDTKYCMRCAKTLAGRKESCWTCRKRIILHTDS